MAKKKSADDVRASIRNRAAYRVVFVTSAQQWFVRKGPIGKRARPVGEGYRDRWAALRGALRRRVRERAVLSPIHVCDRDGNVEYTR